ncbi:hypothetical protein GBA52_027230 [Prunus armeniaca]|nr:hypothetical protein GBA52_027230 [Prunus armeniaca]
METKSHQQLHIFFFPYMAHGHSIPLIDMAKLFASRGVKSTLITTPLNAPLFSKAIQSSKKLGFEIELLVIKFPSVEAGLPQGCESDNMSTTNEMKQKFFRATTLLQPQLEQILDLQRPHCLVADTFFPWATDVAAQFGIPRLIFHGTGFFPLCASLSVILYEPHLKVSSDSEVFTIPNFPVEIKLTGSQIPAFLKTNVETEFTKLYKSSKACEERSYGVIVNSFCELEPVYADHYRKVFGRKAWHIGPVSLCNKAALDKAEMRGMEASLDEHECLNWLNTKTRNSVVYICFGSLTNFSDPQLLEIALGPKASGKEFIWVVRREKKEKEEWLPEGFEQRMEDVKKEASVKRDAIEKAVAQVMVGDEAEGMRSRARALVEMARRAVEEGGSSFSDLTALVEELRSL